MNVQEKLMERVRHLEPEAALRLYDLALTYRREPTLPDAAVRRRGAMERSRRALADLEGSLAEDVLTAGEDRV